MLQPECEMFVTEEIVDLYPDWSPSGAELNAWITALSKYSIVQAREALSDYYTTREGSFKRPRLFKYMGFVKTVRARENMKAREAEAKEDGRGLPPFYLFSIHRPDIFQKTINFNTGETDDNGKPIITTIKPTAKTLGYNYVSNKIPPYQEVIKMAEYECRKYKKKFGGEWIYTLLSPNDPKDIDVPF
jgi:hypothetical protein